MNILWLLLDDSGAPITGGAASTTTTIRRGSDGYLYDWDDATFKASGWVSVTSPMTEVDDTNLEGVYIVSVDVSAWTDDYYQVTSDYSGSPERHALAETYLVDGAPTEDATGASLYVLTGGAGVHDVTLQIYETGTTTAISDVRCIVYSGSDLIASQTTDAAGQCTLYLNDGTYDLRLYRAGVVFALETLVVSGDTTATKYGTPMSIPAAPSADQCTVYEYLFDQPSQTPLAATTATARIRVSTDIGGKTHTISGVDGTYSASTGLVYWTIVRDASIVIDIPETGVNKSFTVPDAASVRVSDA